MMLTRTWQAMRRAMRRGSGWTPPWPAMHTPTALAARRSSLQAHSRLMRLAPCLRWLGTWPGRWMRMRARCARRWQRRWRRRQVACRRIGSPVLLPSQHLLLPSPLHSSTLRSQLLAVALALCPAQHRPAHAPSWTSWAVRRRPRPLPAQALAVQRRPPLLRATSPPLLPCVLLRQRRHSLRMRMGSVLWMGGSPQLQLKAVRHPPWSPSSPLLLPLQPLLLPLQPPAHHRPRPLQRSSSCLTRTRARMCTAGPAGRAAPCQTIWAWAWTWRAVWSLTALSWLPRWVARLLLQLLQLLTRPAILQCGLLLPPRLQATWTWTWA